MLCSFLLPIDLSVSADFRTAKKLFVQGECCELFLFSIQRFYDYSIHASAYTPPLPLSLFLSLSLDSLSVCLSVCPSICMIGCGGNRPRLRDSQAQTEAKLSCIEWTS